MIWAIGVGAILVRNVLFDSFAHTRHLVSHADGFVDDLEDILAEVENQPGKKRRVDTSIRDKLHSLWESIDSKLAADLYQGPTVRMRTVAVTYLWLSRPWQIEAAEDKVKRRIENTSESMGIER